MWFLENNLEEKLNNLKMKPGYPIKPMLADRGSIDVIKTGNHFVEEKYDGYRILAHVDKEKVWSWKKILFSRLNKKKFLLTHSVHISMFIMSYAAMAHWSPPAD